MSPEAVKASNMDKAFANRARSNDSADDPAETTPPPLCVTKLDKRGWARKMKNAPSTGRAKLEQAHGTSLYAKTRVSRCGH